MRSLTAIPLVLAFVAALLPSGSATVLAAAAPAAEPDVSAAAAPITPVTLGFDTEVSGTIADKDGQGTGFALVQPSTTGTYLPANLDLDTSGAGSLIITTTRGIQFKTPTTTTNGNSLDNGLGVTFDGTAGPVSLETTVINPPAGSNSAEQAGPWFGLDQDNYVKLVVASTSTTQMRVQLAREINGVSNGTGAGDEFNTGNLTVSSSTVRLRLVLDPATNTVSGSYQIGTAAPVTVGSFIVPAAFFTGVAFEPGGPLLTSAGIFATHRNRSTSATPPSLQFRFGEFSLAPADVTAPAAPTGLVAATPGTTSVGLDWADNGEADLVGYDVYRAPNPEGPYTKVNATLVSGSTYTDSGLTTGTLYAYQVRAVDGAGNVSAPSAAASAVPDAASPPAVSFPVQVNFQSETAPVPTGYTRDFGQNYANVRGFGWVVPATATPRSLVGNGRDRNDATSPDQRVDTIMHMQGNNVTNFANVALPGAWEIAVPNGTYSVEVSVGDASPGTDATSHELNVEGVKAIDDFVVTSATTGSARWSAATVSATVSDGRLTIDPLGGTNTKINYVVITPAAPPDTTPPDAPTITTPASDGYDTDGDLTLAGGAEAGSSVELFDGTSSVGTTTASAGGSWTIALTAVADGVHVYTAKATDAAPNTSPASAARTITVDTTDPTVTDRSPLADATGVALDVTVSAELSEDLDPATVTATSVTLEAGTSSVSASVDYDPLTDTISLDPSADLAPGTTYTVSLGATISDLAGNTLAATSWDFATVNPTDTTPPDAPTITTPAANGYDTDGIVTVAGTAEVASTVELFDGSTSVGTTTTTAGATWSITLAGVADGVHPYTAKATDAAPNTSPASGVRMITVDTAAPSVTGRDPVADAIGVPVDATVSATFSEDIASATLTGTSVSLSDGTTTVTGVVSYNAATRTASLDPGADLAFGTVYTLSLATAITDLAGNSLAATSWSFTTADPADTTPPDAPTGLTATGSVTGISLDWADSPETDLGGYDVYRSTSATGTFVKLTATSLPPGTSAYNDTSAPAGATSFYEVTASDTSGNESAPVTENAARPMPPCSPYSTLPCAAVPVSMPFSLGWGAPVASTVADKDGEGTGFTMVQPSSAGGGYLPANLDLDSASSGTLGITTTAGIMFKTVGTTTGSPNAQHNGLGVAFGGTAGPVRVETTLINPPAGSNAAEQAGLWFGTSEDNYAKLVVASTGTTTMRVQLMKEINGVSNGAPNDEINTGNLTVSSSTVRLRLVLDPATNTVSGSYQIGTAAPVTVGSFIVPAAFFTGVAFEPGGPLLTSAGIFATHRNRSTSATPPSLQFRFGEFSLAPADVTAPAAPTGLVAATPGTTSVGLDWADNGEADLVGYDVYRAPNPEGPYTKVNATLVSGSTYTDSGLTTGTLYAYQVRAVDGAGNVSAPSAAASAVPDAASPPAVSFPVQVNFQSETAPVPTGYTRDFGQNYANVRGFGWVVPATATPRSLVGNGRDRNDATSPDQRVDTIMHMQGNNVTNFANVALPGAWEIAVPNGTYSVEVSVGDASPGTDATSHELNVEGVKAIDDFVVTSATTGSARWSAATVSATVSDGRLTIDPLGGTNTKINYVVITPAAPPDTTPPDAPTITTPASDGYDTDGDLTLAGGAEAGSSVELFDGTSSVGTTTASAGGSWTIALTAVADGVHVYTAKATDAAPNTSPASAARTITVDTTDPTVTDRSPLADATGVALDVTVSAELSEDLDPATVTATSVTLEAGTSSVSASVDYDPLTDTISLDPSADLAPGTTYTVSLGATISDLAGNTLAATSWDFATVNPTDTTPPDAPTIGLDPLSDTGPSNSDRVTKDATPALTGTAEAASTVTVRDGTTIVAQVVAAAGGTWSATTDPLPEGDRSLTATATDGGGNESALSTALVITVDTTPPGTPVISSPAHGSHLATTDFDVSGSAEPAAAISLRDGGLEIETTDAGPAGSWHVSLNDVADGGHAYTVVAADAAGNVSGASSPVNVIVDTAAPSISSRAPMAGATGVDPAASVTVTFSEAMAAATVTGTSLTLAAGAATPVSATVSYDVGSRTATLDPSVALAPATTYTVTAAASITDLAGNPLAATQWTFTTAAPVTGIVLEFDAARPGTVADKDGEGTGFTSVQPNAAGNQYDPTRIDLQPSGQLQVTGTAGTNTAANTLKNALRVSFDGTQPFTVSSRLVGPLTNLSAATQQGGIYVGPGQDDYVKVVASHNGSVNLIQLFREINGTTVASTRAEVGYLEFAAADWTAITTLDLYLVVTPAAGTIRAEYAINGGTRTLLPTTAPTTAHPAGSTSTYTVPSTSLSSFFNPDSKAGILAFTVAAADANVRFERFEVTAPPSTPDMTAPVAPSNVVASPGNSSVNLTWSANTETDLAGYNVFRGTSVPVSTSGVPLNGATPLTATSYLDTGLANGTTYHYVVEAVDLSGNRSPGTTASATPAAGSGATTIKVNFQSAAAAVPAGYLRDNGQPYGPRTGADQGAGQSYGWVIPGTTTPLDLSIGGTTPGNGRDRNLNPDQRLDTLVHMQGNNVPNFNGTPQPGSWEIAVPNGTYTVTVAVGDAQVNTDPESHTINVEALNAISAFVPSGAAGSVTRHSVASKTVIVADGRLTVDATGGTNTKINYIDIASGECVSSGQQPTVASSNPANAATNVALDAPVTAEVNLPNCGGIDRNTLTSSTVRLFRVSDNSQVSSTVNSSGGGDVIVLQPTANLAANTQYRFEVTNGLRDLSGAAFVPYTATFTTGTSGGGPGGGSFTGSFEKVVTSAPALAGGIGYTGLVVGPDGKLYAGTNSGEIKRFAINADGTLGPEQSIPTIQNANGGFRLLIGMAFDPASTADNLVLWVAHNQFAFNNATEWTSKITRLSGANLEVAQDVLVGLPRSAKDHLTNSIAWGPDGALYFTQGSNSAMGAPDNAWSLRPERQLNGAVLRLDTSKLPTSLPLDVKTVDGGGTYNPFAANAALTIFGSGVRNAYDLVWHSNGQLYVPTNGSASGGNTPGTPSPLPAGCANRVDSAANGAYSGPSVPALNAVGEQHDYLFRVVGGGYYGHPNPVRCEWVLNGGNPTAGTDSAQVTAYPVGTLPDRNWRGNAFDFGLHFSPNGAMEYRSNTFGGSLRGKLLVVRYSAGDDVIVLTPGGANQDIVASQTGATGLTGFTNPLDLTEDTARGNIYLAEYPDPSQSTLPSRIVLLRPVGAGAVAPNITTSPARLIFNQPVASGATATQAVTITNTGNAPLSISGVTIAGANADQFALVGAPTLPATVPADGTLTLSVAFDPSTVGPKGAELRIVSDDAETPTTVVVLRGLGTLGEGGANEPSLQWVLDAYEIPVNAGDPDPTDNSLPATALLGEEVSIQSFQIATDGVVTLQPLAVFGPAGPAGNVVNVGYYNTGSPVSKQQLFSVPNASAQKLAPTTNGTLTFDPGLTAFGFYSIWPFFADREVYSEDSLNTWESITANRHKVRVYPMKDPSGVLVPNTYIVATEEHISGYDYQDVVYIARNLRKATESVGEIATSVPELVFSGIKGTTSATKTLGINNVGNAPLTISSVTLGGTNAADFTIVAPATPLTIGAGETRSVDVRFTPRSTVVGSLSASIAIGSDDADEGTTMVGIYGLSTNGEQGNNEPPLKQVVDTLGYPIDVGGTGLILGTGAAPIGDEVVAPLFQKAGTGLVGLKPVARYSPDELLPFGYYTMPAGEPIHNEVASIALDQEQTLLPAIVAGGTSTFDPGSTSFGIYVHSNTFGRKSYTQDGLNTGVSHATRIYPVKNRAGQLVPNAYLVAFEDATNGDYQDYVFLLTNARPTASGSAGLTAKINFQPAGSTVPAGYTPDTGQPFSATTGSGWVVPGTHTPIDMTLHTRERAEPADQRLKTLILMQGNGGATQPNVGSWEYTLPNGVYDVTVTAGDAAFTDSIHRLTVEGVLAISDFVPTTAELFRSNTVEVNVTDGRLTLDATGGANTKVTHIDIIGRAVSGTDNVPPSVSVGFVGTTQSAGVYRNRVTIAISANDNVGGSGVATTAYSLDGGVFQAYTAPFDVSSLGSHSIRARAIDGAGNATTTVSQNFSIAASNGDISIENLDGVPFADRLVFSRIQTPEDGTGSVPANSVHDVAVLRIHNVGPDPVGIISLPITGPWELASPLTLPAAIPAGGQLDVPVRFIAQSIGSAGGIWNGTLTIGSDDIDEPNTPIQLSGFWQSISEGDQEPNVSEIARVFGYGTAITYPGQALNQNGLVTAVGEEVLSPYWLRANTSQPISVRQLAAYHTQGNTATFFWHVKTSTSTSSVITHLGVDGQSVLPRRSGTSGLPASGTFTPTGAFGIKIDPEWSDPTRNNTQPDIDGGCTGPCGHHVRAWPVRDRDGVLVSNTWLVSMDYAGINYDYNDNVYLISNMKPENPAVDPNPAGAVPGAPSLVLEFDKTYPGTLLDMNGETTGFISTQPNRLDTSPGSDSYKAALLDLDLAAGDLRVDTFGTQTTGSNANLDNTLVNGLQLPFDGSTGLFHATTTLVGPVSNLVAGNQQGGVMFGPSQDNYIKVVAINKSGIPSIEFFKEESGVGVTVGTPIAIPNPSTIASLELVLVADQAAKTVRAAYRVDGGVYVAVPGTVTLSAAQAALFFATQSKAGIMTTNKGADPVEVSFERFAIGAGDPTTVPVTRDALYRLDVAGAAPYTDTAGQVWSRDLGLFSPSTAIDEGASVTPLEIANTQDDVIYRTYRGNVGNVPLAQRVLTYNLGTRGLTSVDLRLHFAERAAGNNLPGERVFDIEAEGQVLRNDFDIVVAAGGQNTAIVVPFEDVQVTDGSLTLVFRTEVDYAAIAGIEVLCPTTCPAPDVVAPAAPTDLAATGSPSGIGLDWADNTESDLAGYNVYRSTSATGTFTKVNSGLVNSSSYNDVDAPAGAPSFYRVTAVDNSTNESAVSNTASATRTAAGIRINTGGPAQSVNGVAWSACTALTACSGYVTGGFAFAQSPVPTITGMVAPANQAVYQTEWTGGQTNGIPAGGVAFTFGVPVTNGSYQVRLHFAELNKTGAGQRVFDVNIEGGANELTGFDVWQQAAGINKAIVREFTTTVTDGTLTIQFIRQVENAKISGIEILPTPPDTTPPAAPTELVMDDSSAAIRLDWANNAEADLAGYNVYRGSSASGPFTKLNATVLTASAYIDFAATVDAPSHYQVRAVDNAGNQSDPSAIADGTRPSVGGPSTIGWSTVASQAFTNSEAQGAVVGGKLYVFGGFDSTKACCTPTRRAFVFDPTANTWTPIAPLPKGVTHAGMATDGTDIFYAGGYIEDAAQTGQIFGTREVWRYSPTTNTYTALPLLPVERAAGQLVVLGGELHYFGGTNLARTQDVGDHYMLTLGGTAWTTKASLPNPRHHMGAAVLDGFIYAIGGQHGHDDALVTQADVHAYDAATNTWTPRASLPTARGHIASATVLLAGRIVVAGGETSHGVSIAAVSAYDPAQNAWSALTQLPAARASGVAGAIAGQLYYTTGSGTATTYKGVPGTATPPDVVAPAAPTDLAATGSPSGIGLDWADNTESDLAGYNVYRSTSATGTFTKVNSGLVNSSSYNDVDAPAGAPSFYRVTAVDNSTNESAVSNTASATRTAAGIRINTGGPAQSVNGVAWSACTALTACSGYVTGGFAFAQSPVPTITGMVAPANQAVYQTEWTGGQTNGIPAGGVAFTFGVPVTNGSYQVRLHFAELNKTGAGQRVFDVNIEGGANELTGFDVWQQAAGINKAIVREFTTTVTDGTLTIQFIRQVENAKISGIEILPTPPDTTPPAAPVISAPPNNSFDTDGAFTVSGTAEAASTVNLFEGTTNRGTATASAGGSWSIPLSGVADGVHTYTATATDAATNISPVSVGRTITVDSVRPLVSTTVPTAGASGIAVGANVTATFSEPMTAASLTTTSFSLAPTSGGPAVAAAVTYDPTSRVATLDPTAALAAGVSYTATITTGPTDLAGNSLATARTWSFSTATATGPASLTFVSAADTYARSLNPNSNYGLETTLLTRLETSASNPRHTTYLRFQVAGLGGRTVTGATLRLYSTDGGPNGGSLYRTATTWTETGLTASNAPAPTGSALASVGVVATDAWHELSLPAGLVTGDGPLDLVIVPLNSNSVVYSSRQGSQPPQLVLQLADGGPTPPDTTPPAAPVISAPPNNSFDTDGAFTVSGTAEAASTVNLFEGTTNRGTATASAGGSWSIPLSGVADGVHTYTATATDAATNISPVSVGRTITVDSVRPLVSTTVPTAGASGIAVGANVTATFSEPMTAASLTTTSFSLAPTSGGPAVAAAVTYDPTSRVATLDPTAALAAGVSYTATITTGPTDLAGNSLATARTWSFSTAVATDTTPPAAPVISAPPNNSFDTDGAFTVSGTAEAASTVNLFEGTTNRGTATASAGGSWSIPLSGVADGVHTYTATATDAATNISPVSVGRTITVDSVRPLVSTTVPTAGASGIAVGANVTATFSEPMTAASLTTTSFSLAPTSGGPAVAAAVTYDPTSRVATLDPTAALAAGVSYTATITTGPTDLAGNSLATARTWSFSTATATGPASLTFVSAADTYARSLNPNSNYGLETTLLTRLETSASNPRHTTYLRFQVAGLGGRTVTGATLRLYSTDGGPNGGSLYRTATTWTETGLTASNAPAPTGSALASVGVVATDAWHELSLPAGLVTGDGPLDLVIVPLNSNSVVYSSRQGSQPPQLVLQLADGGPTPPDTTPPAAPVISAPPNNSFDTDGAFTVSGTAEAASTVNLFEGTTNRGTATASAGGSWSIPLSGVADGVHTYTATATDAATNISPVSVGRTITVDSVRPLVSTTVPTAGASGIAVGANVTATFSEPMTAASLTTTSFSLAPTSGGPAVAAAVTYDPTSRVATLDPTAALAAGVSYTATITTGPTDLAGNSLATARTWSFSTATATGPASLTFVSAADTYARSLNPNSNYGLETTLLTRLETSASNPRHTTYLRFQVAGLGGRTVTGATLRLYSTDGGPNGGSLYRTATTWTETGLTASNAPAPTGSALASVGVVATDAWHELSLPAGLVTGDGPLDLVIVPLNSNSVVYSSRQGSQPPQLVLQLADGGPTALGTRQVSPSTSTPSVTAAASTTPSPGATAAPIPIATAALTPAPRPSPSATLGLTPTQPTGTAIKNITFEDGLRDPTSGVDTASGGVAIDRTRPIQGTASGRLNKAAAYVQEDFTHVDDLYLRLLLRLDSLPSTNARLIMISNGGETVGNLVLTSSGRLRLREGMTRVGSDSDSLRIGVTYVVTLHQRAGTGANALLEADVDPLALLEADVDPLGSPATTPFARRTTGTWTTGADNCRIGGTDERAVDVTFDDVRFALGGMPPA